MSLDFLFISMILSSAIPYFCSGGDRIIPIENIYVNVNSLLRNIVSGIKQNNIFEERCIYIIT